MLVRERYEDKHIASLFKVYFHPIRLLCVGTTIFLVASVSHDITCVIRNFQMFVYFRLFRLI